MTIAVDLGRKATKQTNKINLVKHGQVFKKLCMFSLIWRALFFRELGFHTSCLIIGLNFPPYIDKVLYFHILFLLEYLVSAESRRQFKPVLGDMTAAALSAETE